ncbi:MAG: hypothetical protein PHD11_06260 [Bacteroidales bacterium]|nr:hypothetical protein [Bacteroidales bacterium]MDD4669572.1 hypothetical protein [Bacteroidales bacterium]
MNLRVIKKDIDFLVGDFVEDCVLFSLLHPEKDTTEVEKLINGANKLANDLFDRVNHPDKTQKIKVQYKAVIADMYKGLDELCEKLSALAK